MSWLSNLFGGNQKRDTTYQGPKPYGSLREAAGGEDYYKNIMSRLQGQGVGYGEGYADRTSSPIIKRMRNQFSSYDIPALTSELSATGRRRGSAGFDQMRRAYQEQGLNEGEVYANLDRENTVQSRNEINDASERLGAFNKGDYDARGNIANFEYANNRQQVADAGAQRDAGNAAFQRLIGVGTAMLPTGGASSIAKMPSFSTTDFASNKFVPWGSGGSYYDRVARKNIMQSGGVSPVRTRIK